MNLHDFNLEKMIVLVGLPGAGKSSIGRSLSHILGVSFVDSDRKVEEFVGCSIVDIFKYNGEDYFKMIEEKVVLDLLRSQPQILATGGSTFSNEILRKDIIDQAIVVWLQADFNILLERISRRNTRPIFQEGNKADTLQELMEKQNALFSKAHIIVNSSNGSHQDVAEEIVDRILDHEG